MESSKNKPYILKFDQIKNDNLYLVGGKGLNLGILKNAGFSVPDGFCITTHAYFDFLYLEVQLKRKSRMF